MPLLALPHTIGCLVCGRDNPHGLRLALRVDPDSAQVSADFTPGPHHIGFDGIVHGGILATVLDEVMVWAATWSGLRFCVCGELNVRFRRTVPVGATLTAVAKIEATRSRLIETSGVITDAAGTLYCSGSAKYIPLPPERSAIFIGTLVDEPQSAQAAAKLRQAARVC